jgi:hypothetical protein
MDDTKAAQVVDSTTDERKLTESASNFMLDEKQDQSEKESDQNIFSKLDDIKDKGMETVQKAKVWWNFWGKWMTDTLLECVLWRHLT